MHGSFLGSSPYCFSYLFYKEVHWFRFISKETQLLQPGGIPHPKHSQKSPYNTVFLLHPSIEDPETPGRGSQPHPLQAWLLPSTRSCGSGHSTGPRKVSCPVGSSPLSCHTSVSPSGKEKRSAAPSQRIKPQSAPNPSNRITKRSAPAFLTCSPGRLASAWFPMAAENIHWPGPSLHVAGLLCLFSREEKKKLSTLSAISTKKAAVSLSSGFTFRDGNA